MSHPLPPSTTSAASASLRLRQWAAAARLPFTSVAVVPFVVGAYLAQAHGELVSPLAAVLGTLAVFLICLGCYFSGEVFDQREDLETLKHGRNPFSGGSLMVAQGILPVRQVRLAAGLALVLAGVCGAVILAIHGNLVLIGLGCFGMLAAATYSTEPVRLVRRGIGELFIGLCYGWLPLATGYACAAGHLPPLGPSVLASLPVCFAVFNIIFLNEFPDYEADRSTGKRNLLVRAGRPAGAVIYAAAALAVAIGLLAAWWSFRRASLGHLALTLPGAGLAIGLAAAVARGAWREPRRLERLCALTIVLDLASALIVGALARWS
jgi:1,4-dihydroxy-2-naphthoate polyprenyltransferase